MRPRSQNTKYVLTLSQSYIHEVWRISVQWFKKYNVSHIKGKFNICKLAFVHDNGANVNKAVLSLVIVPEVYLCGLVEIKPIASYK